MLLIGCPKTSDEGVEASPGLPERAGARRRRSGLAEEDATVQVNLGFPKLVEVTEEVQDVVEVALRECNWGALVLQVLPEGVPVSPLLRLVTAQRLFLMLMMVLLLIGGRL